MAEYERFLVFVCACVCDSWKWSKIWYVIVLLCVYVHDSSVQEVLIRHKIIEFDVIG